jgi:ADP-heptose:LPS heptosyltransferase
VENGNSIPESKVLVVKMSSLGDLFHALPAVRCLKRGLNATVDWVTQPEYVELVGSFADVRKVIAFPRRGFFSGMKAFAAALRRERYDYVVDLQGLLKSAVVVALARGGRRIGPSFSREGASLFYDAVAGVRNKERHAVEEAMEVVRQLNLPVLAPEFP